MNKKSLAVALAAVSFVVWAASACSHPSEPEDGSRTGIRPRAAGGGATAAEPAAAGPGRRRAGGPPEGRGQGAGPGRWSGVSTVALDAAEREAIGIRLAKVERRPVRDQLRAMGKVSVPQDRRAIVSYPFPARIAEVHAVPGRWVEAGQKLVTLLSEEVGTARAEFYKTQADHELAVRTLEREKQLFERGAGAQKNVLTAEAQLKVAQAYLEAAEKKLHLLGFSEAQVDTLRRSHEVNPTITLFAPFRGKVAESRAVLGAMVDQSTEILTLMDPSVLWVEAEIYERDIARVRVGQTAEISVPAYPGEAFDGRLSYIGDTLREETRTIAVRTEVRNPAFKLKPGMFADVRIIVGETGSALVVPSAAVLDDDGDRIVFVPRDGGFLPRLVRVGIEENGVCQVLDGLSEGEEVVVAGGFQLLSKLHGAGAGQAHIH